METTEQTWERICTALITTPYVLDEEYEFERSRDKIYMYYHASLQKCVLFMEAAQDWIQETPEYSASAQLLLDKAGSEVVVSTLYTPAALQSLRHLFCCTHI